MQCCKQQYNKQKDNRCKVQTKSLCLFSFGGKECDILPENILKPKSSKLPLIIIYGILILGVVGFVVYLTYCYNYYLLATNQQTAEFDIESLMNAFAYVGQPMTFLGDLLKKSILMQVTDLWLIYLILLGIVIVMTTSDYNPFKGMAQGSARFATEAEKKAYAKDTTGIPCGKDFYVPIDGKIGLRRVAPNLNELVIGGSGAGKTLRKIIADIMQMWGSYVITDPKGELFRKTYKFLKANGYDVKVLNLIDIRYSNSYNPFEYMETEQDVIEVCSLFMSSSAGEGEKEDFFTGSALEFLTAISVYLFKSEYETKSFGRVIRLVNSVRYNNGQIDENCELARCMGRHATKHPFDFASITWPGLINTAQETFTSIQKTLSTRLRLWATEDVDLLTEEDEMNFDEIGTKKVAIFMIIPVPRNTYKAVSNIFYSQLFTRLFRVADSKYHGKWKNLISFELDEFAQIGVIPDFSNILAIARSYNIRICPVLQDLSQLKVNYKDTWETVMANCAIHNFLGTTDDATCEKLSKKLGNFTVRTDSKSYNRTTGGGGSDTEAITTRPLLYPDEIKEAVKPKGDSIPYDGSCIVWVGYERPFYMYKFDTFNHPNFSLVGGPEGTLQFKNNTDIKEVYGKIFANKKEKHLKTLELSRIKQVEEEEILNKQQEEKEALEQIKLANLFNEASKTDFPEPPLSDEDEEARDDAVFVEEFDGDIIDETYQSEPDYENNVNPVLERIRKEQFDLAFASDEDMPE